MRAALHACVGAAALFLSSVQCVAQEDDAMEQFEEVDPHTGGKAKYTDKLGYESFGPFEFVG
ncbi:MAG: hypothetical protein ACYTFV_16490, partial [Planctomycetota bacterium]